MLAWKQFYADMQKRCQTLAWAVSQFKSGMDRPMSEKGKRRDRESIGLSPAPQSGLLSTIPSLLSEEEGNFKHYEPIFGACQF